MNTAPPILVVGDSHASFFGGVDAIVPPHPAQPLLTPQFEVHHIGPGLAASLVERSSENDTRAKAMHALAGRDPATTRAVILCFGEIDCRFHILRRAGSDSIADGARIRRSIEVTAHRYLSFVLEVALAGFTPVVFGPVATTPLRYDPPYEWPTLGSIEERNRITREFTAVVGELCGRHRVEFVSIFENLVDAGLGTRPEHYFDGVHLRRTAWPMFMAAIRRTSSILLPVLEEAESSAARPR